MESNVEFYHLSKKSCSYVQNGYSFRMNTAKKINTIYFSQALTRYIHFKGLLNLSIAKSTICNKVYFMFTKEPTVDSLPLTRAGVKDGDNDIPYNYTICNKQVCTIVSFHMDVDKAKTKNVILLSEDTSNSEKYATFELIKAEALD